MNKTEIVDLFEEIAVLLELKGENPFKSRAYLNAARALETCAEPLEKLVAEDRLQEIKGLGEALREKVEILVKDGRLPYYEELKASLPPGLPDLLKIPGLGPKKLKVLNEKLGVTDLTSLEAACRSEAILKLAGFGEKSVAKLLAGIEQFRTYARQHRAGDVLPLAEGLVETLRSHPAVIRISLAGSLRRGKEIIKDIDMIASSKDPAAVMEAFVGLPGVLQVVNHGETKSSVLLEGGVPCDLRVVEDFQYPYALHHFTGSKEHNVALRQRAISRGMKMSEWGLFRQLEGDREGERIVCRDESELFRALDLDFIPPELRENLGEIEAAEAGKLPRLVEWTELRGCFHNHTTASDGRNTLEEMAAAADALGLEYLGIADHSKSSFQAHGLNEDQLRAQVEQIRELNESGRFEVRLLAGVECDILKGGDLDFADDVLAGLDYVVASIHAGFSGNEAEMTARLTRAMENPFVTMLGHPTGRLLLQREGYPVDLGRVIEVAAATGTWIELNASPWRLDLDWRWWRRAAEAGVKCAINPDAHAVEQLGYLRFGVAAARKGWLTKGDVINTLPLREVEQRLGNKRRRAGLK
ncbi:MAG: DNA polymerase/3'-5' exonuclease PolX [Candidatus Methylacidiphilales bacterium]